MAAATTAGGRERPNCHRLSFVTASEYVLPFEIQWEQSKLFPVAREASLHVSETDVKWTEDARDDRVIRPVVETVTENIKLYYSIQVKQRASDSDLWSSAAEAGDTNLDEWDKQMSAFRSMNEATLFTEVGGQWAMSTFRNLTTSPLLLSEQEDDHIVAFKT
jgi:hypothetical protein